MANLVISIKERSLPPSIGSKAGKLRLLQERGFPIPETFVILWDAHQRHMNGDESVIENLKRELQPLLRPDTAYAIRSSADVEDTLDNSFAGQFKTVLDRKGVDGVLQAIWSVWATANTSGSQRYRQRKNDNSETVRMAILVQEMVPAVHAGVAFSRNPMTGANETVIEAVSGLGTQLVQDGVTPNRWVNRSGGWVVRADDSSIPLDVIHQVVSQTRNIEKVFKYPVDLEWAHDGRRLVWLQMRPITSLAELNIYSNRISRDMLPGIIKPLVWSVNIPLVNTVWVQLLTQMIGKNDIQPESLAKSFYYRTYFNMSTFGKIFNLLGFPSEGLEMMMGITPRESGTP